MPSDKPPLDALARAVLDGEGIDWAEAESGPAGPLVRHVKVIAAVANAHRGDGSTTGGIPLKRAKLAPLEMWGHLRIIECIGSGAFGDVYRARDSSLERDVALKLVPEAEHEQLAASMLREGRLLARVRHPNVVTIYGADRIGGWVGLWMELVRGRTLAEVLRKGSTLKPSEVVRIGIELTSALSAVHGAGLLHRDIKAQNVMRADDGRVLLMDFGSGRDLSEQESDMTGTPLYLAPEVFRGEPATARTDIYSLGVLLYHLLTKSFPVRGRTINEVRQSHDQQDRVLLRATRHDVPVALAKILDRATAPQPGERYATAEELRAALESVLTPDRRWPWYAAAAVFVVFVVWGAAALVRPDSPGLQVGVQRPLTAAALLEINPSLSPDGTSVAYTATSVSRDARTIVQALPADDKLLLGTGVPLNQTSELENQPRWSHDGKQILYITPEGVRIAPASGGESKLVVGSSYTGPKTKTSVLAFLNGISAAAWSPDDQRLVIADNSSRTLSIVSLADRQRRTIARGIAPLHSCDWSPDGRWIACALGTFQHFAAPGSMLGNISNSAIVIVPASEGELKTIVDASSMNQSPAWSADSGKLYFVSNRFGEFDIFSQQLEDGVPRGEPFRETTGLHAFAIAFSQDRKRLAYTETWWRSKLWRLPIPLSGVVSAALAEPVTNDHELIESVNVSRSGKYVLFDSNIKGNFHIFRMPLSGGAREQLTDGPYQEFAPDSSYDDKILAYHSFRPQSGRDVYVKDLATGMVTQVTKSQFDESNAVWLPDNALVFWDMARDVKGTPRGAFLTRRSGDGSWNTPEGLMKGGFKVSVDPRGRFLATVTASGIEVLQLDTRDRSIIYRPSGDASRPGPGQVVVSDDGRTLYFKTQQGGAKIWSVPVSGGPPTLLVDFQGRPSSRTDFGAGGGYFFFTIDDRKSNVYIANIVEH